MTQRQPEEFIFLRRIAYGPHGFTCACGGTKFEPERKKFKYGSDSTFRNSHRCKKCQVSYIFVPSTFAYGGVR